jgi:hypothetical protein
MSHRDEVLIARRPIFASCFQLGFLPITSVPMISAICNSMMRRLAVCK